MSFNQIIILGNLGQDPEEVATRDQNQTIARLQVATDRITKGTFTDWHTVTVWNGVARACLKYLKKGSKVQVIGEMRYNTVVQGDGTKKYYHEINAQRVEFLDRPTERAEEAINAPAHDGHHEDGIPF